MAQPSIKLVQDRLYAIAGAIGSVTLDGVATTIKAFRTFPTSMDTANMPCIFSLQGQVTSRNPANAGAQYAQVTRQYDLVLLVDNWNGGIPTETAQKRAEILTDLIEDVIVSRPRLELDGNTPLDGVISAVLGNDSGVIPIYPSANSSGYAGVRFPLLVTTRRLFTFEISTLP